MENSNKLLTYTHLYYVVRTDDKGNYTYVNDFFKERFSFLRKGSSFIGTSTLESILSEDHQRCVDVSVTCLKTPNRTYPVVLRKPSKTGGSFWTQWEFMATYVDEEEDTLEIICVGHDITDAEATRQLATSSSRELDLLLEHISDGFVQVDTEWKILRANRVFEEYSAAIYDTSCVGKPIWDFFVGSSFSTHYEELRKAMQKQQEVRFEEYMEAQKRWYAFQAYPAVGGLAIFMQDVSVQKAQVQEILEQNQRLKKIAHLQSHVVRAPLANMLGLLEILRAQQLTTETKYYVELMLQAGHKLDNVIHEIVYNTTQLEVLGEEEEGKAHSTN
jgi:PAS domain-containing protein